jgi:phospholipid-binding lipoprotein MlaA
MKRIAAIVGMAGVLMTGPVQASEKDPWESFNRDMYAFNDTLDVYFLKPVATGYRNVTPDFVEKGVSNFFGNIYELRTITNDLLQGKLKQAGEDSTRFFINTTVGLFGVVDVAGHIDLSANDEDFGQTLSVWGVPAGPYVMLPVLGPSTVTDTAGRIPEMSMELFEEVPDAYFGVENVSIPLAGAYAVSKRAQLLDVEGMVAGDRYTFIRDAYLHRREFQVSDGAISEELLNDDLGEDFFEE